MCKVFFFSSKMSADRELCGRTEMSMVHVMSPVNTVLHIHPILAWIFIVHHVFICVCLYVCVWVGKTVCGSESPAGVWGKTQQEAENPRCLWISVSEQEARHRAACALSWSQPLWHYVIYFSVTVQVWNIIWIPNFSNIAWGWCVS